MATPSWNPPISAALKYPLSLTSTTARALIVSAGGRIVGPPDAPSPLAFFAAAAKKENMPLALSFPAAPLASA